MQSAAELRELAYRAVLDGLTQGQGLDEIERQVAKANVRGVYSPDVAMLEMIVAALDVAGVSPERPASTAGWRERYLPEVSFRNRHREQARFVYALQTAAALRTGLRPDILDDTYSWGAEPLWPHATRAAVATIRAVADGADISVICGKISEQMPALEP